MRISAIIGMGLTTALHFISIICGFLTDPITPEDLIIYRKINELEKMSQWLSRGY